MCLIIFSVNTHPDFPLIIAANRDEFYERGTEPAHIWEDPDRMLGGRDLKSGGTWLGIHPGKGFAMLTNYRDPSNINPAAPTRGRLVTDYFRHESGPRSYLDQVAREGQAYNGFNLICSDREEIFYYSNYGQGVEKVQHGIHGLSNALIDDPWPKVVRGRRKMEELIRKRSADPVLYLEMLYDDSLADDSELPATGVPHDTERLLSAMFIKSPGYGSRSSTVIMADNHGVVRFIERTFDPVTLQSDDKEFLFHWEPN